MNLRTDARGFRSAVIEIDRLRVSTWRDAAGVRYSLQFVDPMQNLFEGYLRAADRFESEVEDLFARLR